MIRPSERRRGTRAERRVEAAEAAEFRDTFSGLATPERLREMLSDRWMTTSEILAELGLETRRGRSPFVARTLQERGVVRRDRSNLIIWTWGGSIKARPLTEYAPTGPSLLPGRGEKRDCTRYGACLTALTRAVPYAERGHCPAGCAYFVEPSRRDALVAALADVGVRQRGANFGGWYA